MATVRQRLATDAEFRAHVETALQLADLELRRRTGEAMTTDEAVVATLVAGYATDLAEKRAKRAAPA
jgi:hypothetical protein